MQKQVLKNVCHRGALINSNSQNSMQAFKDVIAYDFDAFETDVWITKDEVPIIVHGQSSEGLQIVWNIETKDYEFIYIIDTLFEDFDKKYRHDDKETKFPSLEQVLNEFKDVRQTLIFEIKDYREICYKRVLETVNKVQPTSKTEYHSFDQKQREYIDKWSEKLGMGKQNFGYLFHTNQHFQDLEVYKKEFFEGDVCTFDIQYAHRPNLQVKEFAMKLKEIGYEIRIYNIMDFTRLEGDKLYQEVIDFGATAFVNNRPDLLKQFNDKNTTNKYQ